MLVDSNALWLPGGAGEGLLKDVLLRAQASPKALSGKVGIVGFSTGGGVSLAYATRMPELVAGVATFYPLTNFITEVDGFVGRTKVPTLVMPAALDTYKNCCLIEMARKVAAAVRRPDVEPVATC